VVKSAIEKHNLELSQVVVAVRVEQIYHSNISVWPASKMLGDILSAPIGRDNIALKMLKEAGQMTYTRANFENSLPE
jgi:hypothetical protein